MPEEERSLQNCTSTQGPAIESNGQASTIKPETGTDTTSTRSTRRYRRLDMLARVLLIMASLALLVSPRYPYWTLKLAAPQYPKGLSLSIHPHRVDGDVDEIDGLNHYIGMRKINDAAPLERRLGIPVVILMSVGLLGAAVWRSRWAVLLVVPAILFPPLFLGDLAWWLRDSGLNLDPKAAFSSSIKPFVPRVLGHGKIAQFHTDALLGPGYYLSLLAAGLALFFLVVRLRRGAPRGVSVVPSAGITPRLVASIVVALVALMAGQARVSAAEIVVRPGESLNAAIAGASASDTVRVIGGVHPGPVVIRAPITLVGERGACIDGHGKGTVVRIEAPKTVLRGFTIQRSGTTLEREDAGVVATVPDVVVEGNTLDDVLFGIYLRQSHRSIVRGNSLRGKALPIARRGDLIRLWYSHDTTVEANTAEEGRDVVLWYSNHLKIHRNHVNAGRYGLHFMYCDDADVRDNQLSGNAVGAFLMYSVRLHLEGNWIVANRGVSGYGIGLKDMEDISVARNVLAANRVGIFMEHAQGRFDGNYVADNDRGLVIFPSAQGNRFRGNSFVENGEQVVIEGFSDTMVTNRWTENYWSDYRGFDRDGNGIGDQPYQPALLFEQLADRNAALRLFSESLSARAIDFASRLFPVFAPRPKFRDDAPRMAPVPPALVVASNEPSWHWLALGVILLVWPASPALARTLAFRGTRLSGGLPSGGSVPSPEPSSILSPEVGQASPLPAVRISGLKKRFGRAVVVDDVSFEVGPRETVALWGPNGAGKTTILRCILGLLPFEGAIHVQGERCGPRGRASRRLLGYVPQEIRLHVDQSVRETIRFYARLRRVGPERVDQLMKEWGLNDFDHKLVRQLSGGMRQKLALVIALLSDPSVLLLDEPTSNLDARTRREFVELLVRLKAQGKSLLFCTHRPSEVWQLADKVVVLERGRMRAEGTAESVRSYLQESARLCLYLPSEDLVRGVERLRACGFHADLQGGRVLLDVTASEKIQSMDVIRSAGISILDFDLESNRSSSGGSSNE